MFFFVEGSLCLVSIKKKPNTHFVGPKPPTKPKALCCETGSARRRLLSINQKKKKLLKKKIKKKKKGYARRRSVRLRPTGKRVPKSAMCGIALVLSGDCLVVASSTAAATAAAASGTPFSDEVLSLASVKTYQRSPVPSASCRLVLSPRAYICATCKRRREREHLTDEHVAPHQCQRYTSISAPPTGRRAVSAYVPEASCGSSCCSARDVSPS